MWLHIVIFVILLLLTVCSTLGWIHVENIGTAKGRKMFLVVALAGNITGGLLTWTKGGGQVFEDGYELKKEENAYEEKFMVSVEGEETGSVYVQIPEKELEKEDTGQPSIEEVIRKVNSMAHPLALYIFAQDKAICEKVTSECGFGGGCINDVIIHLATSEMPFGGFGESGMGGYHGQKGFETFSHYKSIVDKKTWIDLPMRYQPYRRIYDKLIHLFLK